MPKHTTVISGMNTAKAEGNCGEYNDFSEEYYRFIGKLPACCIRRLFILPSAKALCVTIVHHSFTPARLAANVCNAAKSSCDISVFNARASAPRCKAVSQQVGFWHIYAPRPAAFPVASIFTVFSGVRTTRINSRFSFTCRQAIHVRCGTCFFRADMFPSHLLINTPARRILPNRPRRHPDAYPANGKGRRASSGASFSLSFSQWRAAAG